MSSMAALFEEGGEDHRRPAPAPTGHAEAFLPLKLSAAAEAARGLIASGLAARAPSHTPLTDETGALRPEIAPLARAYEAALVASLSPAEVQTLHRLLTKVEAAALKLSGRV